MEFITRSRDSVETEVTFYVLGPMLGAVIAAWSHRRDRVVLIKGGTIGGLCQGAIVLLILKRGYPFQNIPVGITQSYLIALAIHVLLETDIGFLLFPAFEWAHSQAMSGDTTTVE